MFWSPCKQHLQLSFSFVLQNKKSIDFKKRLKQKTINKKKLKLFMFSLKVSSYFEYKQIKTKTFETNHTNKTKCNSINEAVIN